MSQVTTKDCKQAIIKWAKEELFIEYLEKHIKRESKRKDRAGRWVREFSCLDLNTFDTQFLYITETDQGLEISTFDPEVVWYYQIYPVGYNPDTTLCIVSSKFWEENGHLDDTHIAWTIQNILPSGFYEDCESMFSTDLSEDQARTALNAAGFVEQHLFDVE